MNEHVYFPRPGSVAYRALALLEAQPNGHRLTAGAMAGELGVSGATLLSSIEQALAYGLVVRSTPRGQERPGMFHVDRGACARARRSLQISSVEEEAVPAPAAPEPAAADPASAPAELQEPVAPEAEEAPRQRADLVLLDCVRPASGSIVVALWSDGTLEIARRSSGGDDLIAALTPAETRQLVAYMDTMSLDWLREAS